MCHSACPDGQLGRSGNQQTAPALPHRISGKWGWGCLGSEVTFSGGEGKGRAGGPEPRRGAPTTTSCTSTGSSKSFPSAFCCSSPSLAAAGATWPELLSLSCQSLAPATKIPWGAFAWPLWLWCLARNRSAQRPPARGCARFVQYSAGLMNAYFETATMTLIKAGQPLLIGGVT